MGGAFGEIAILLALAAVVGLAAVRLRQPVVIAFILVGILAGPAGFGFSSLHEEVELLARLGVTILLFLVGLKLDFALVRDFGPAALATGLGQLAFTIGIGYLIALGLGLEAITALYVAIALTFSSTIIIVKLLSDKRELDSLHGRIAVGFLIVQDIAVVIAIAVIGAMGAGLPTGAGSLAVLPAALIAGALVLAALMRFVLPRAMHMLARSPDLLVIFAFAWGTLFAAIGEALGLSLELGAFVAGFSLASTGYREALSARLASVRDLLLLFFFVDLGARLEFIDPVQTALQATTLSIFILVGNPLIVMAIMGVLGYRARTGFLAGLTVAQISEFSLIFISLGIAIGHVPPETMGLVTLVGITTIALSTYMILYSQRLYPKLQRFTRVFQRTDPFREHRFEESLRERGGFDVIVYGLGRYGSGLIRRLHANGCRVLAVDVDPERVRAARGDSLEVAFGDAGDPEYPAHLPLDGVSWVVSTLPDRELNTILLEALKREGYGGKVALTVHHESDAEALRSIGADAILAPFADAASAAADFVYRGPGTSPDEEVESEAR